MAADIPARTELKVTTGPITVPLTISGSFGVWQTFVGGGPDAW